MNDNISPKQIHIIDYPASNHNGSGTIAFADGHAETRKWIDDRTTPPVSNKSIPLVVPSPNNMDMVFLSSRSSVRKN